MVGRLLGLVFALLLVSNECQAAHLDVAKCAPTGFVTNDNDIRLYDDSRPSGKSLVVPQAITEWVRTATKQMVAGEPDLTDGLTCDMVTEQIYQVSGFGRSELFVADLAIPTGPSYFYLIMYDPITGAQTKSPPSIGSKWPDLFGAQDALVQLPLVSVSDLLHDGRRQILFQERVHNGTDYNAVIYHYFELGPHLELTRVLARETRAIAPDGENLIVREVSEAGPNRLRLETYEASIKQTPDRKLLGYLILERTGPGSRFHVTERHPQPGINPGTLLTDCEGPADDDVFLRDGCIFYY